ncbi:hypothetical protein SAMN05444000_11141 [Shimia gijangensis]|uniref:DUF4034 domain-containing protein n=1 Tax=Shimia gijangensis TaxID=1470563 RepID=A0A1M6KZY2_9RHOB|nr:hypothetical protein [Shimia gijangensis]SHJ64467.1 hypothetical protein SAMN05444000_11141 [Shimia gijangensis]
MTFISDKKAQLAGLFSPSLPRERAQRPKSARTSDFGDGTFNVTYREMQERLHIPIRETTLDQEEGDKAREFGLYMARQERWDELAEKIKKHDQARDATPAGVQVAELMAFGARSDVVRAAEHSLLHGRAAADSDFFSGVEALEAVLCEYPDDYAIALIVAHMHIDIGWAWRGARSTDVVKEINREAFEAHFQRATDILSGFDPHDMQSAALSAARCALLPSKSDPGAHLIREFEALIDLDPDNPRHMRALGNYLLPRWYGSYQALDLEARRTAARTFSHWGAGAYTWVWFDALLVDPEGFDTLEAEYFLDGVKDILECRPNQHIANLLAAHLFQSWQITRERYHETGCRPDLPPALRRGFEDVVHNHLRELHPLIWGHAEIGFENTARIISAERLANKGQETALNAVAMPFLQKLQAGETVQFGPDGIQQNDR